jgi:hypothetical protein
VPDDLGRETGDEHKRWAAYPYPTAPRSGPSAVPVTAPFAHLKRILKMARLRLRGPCGAQDEFLLAATAQNLRKLAKLVLPTGPRVAQEA